MLKRIMSFMLALVMVAGLLPPVTVRAEEDPVIQEAPVPETTAAATIAAEEIPPANDIMPASDEVPSGTCGENLTWTLDDSGKLTISGTGAMDSYINLSGCGNVSKLQNGSDAIVKKFIIFNCKTVDCLRFGDVCMQCGEFLCSIYKIELGTFSCSTKV